MTSTEHKILSSHWRSYGVPMEFLYGAPMSEDLKGTTPPVLLRLLVVGEIQGIPFNAFALVELLLAMQTRRCQKLIQVV